MMRKEIQMANRSYLCSCDSKTINPSLRIDGFDPTVHTLAEGTYCVPLLWLCCFCPDDLTIDVADTTENEWPEFGMVTDRNMAIDRLDGVLKYVAELFRDECEIVSYGKFFRKLLVQSPDRYLSVELMEIADLDDHNLFRRQLTELLSALERQVQTPPTDASATEKPRGFLAKLFAFSQETKTNKLAPAKDAVVRFLELDLTAGFPTIDYIRSGAKIDEAKAMNHHRIVGGSHIRTVPWE
jgi:hypothetical protein